MSAMVIDMRSRQVTHIPAGETLEQRIDKRVLGLLRGKVRGEVIAMAQARALRIMRCETTTIDRAIQRAVAWAMCSDDNNFPPLPAA